MINHKKLLKKYMRHVIQCEGISFIDRLNERMSSEVEFLDKEVKRLKEIEDVIMKEGVWE